MNLCFQKKIIIASLLILFGCKENDISRVNSITGNDYKGNKLFLAWAANVSADLSNGLSAQTRFDVSNMHNIFSKEWGGGYKTKSMVDNQEAKGANILAAIKGAATQYNLDKDSMYFQYSAGHGSPTGLIEDVVGVSPQEYKEMSYTDIAKAVLTLPSREIVIFTMACGSGGLIEAFKKEEALLKKWQDEGRSFFIMTSSSSLALTSANEGSVPNKNYRSLPGTIGSPFGRHLHEALKGAADGYGALGKKDGKITLAEIRDYVTNAVKNDNQKVPKFEFIDGQWQSSKTEVELQVPVYFGFNYENLHMTGLDNRSAPSDSNIRLVEKLRLQQYADQITSTQNKLDSNKAKSEEIFKNITVYSKKIYDSLDQDEKLKDLRQKIAQKYAELEKMKCQSENTAEGLKDCAKDTAESIERINKEISDLSAQMRPFYDLEEKQKRLSPEERPKYAELIKLQEQCQKDFVALSEQLQKDYLALHNKLVSLLKQGMQ